MNEQQLQQILTIQQAIAAAATAAVINSLLNPQQAGALSNVNALTETLNNANSVDLQSQQDNLLHQLQQRTSSAHTPPDASSSPANAPDCNNRIQELLMQLQQQAALGNSPMALNLNLAAQTPLSAIGNANSNNNLASPIRSPISGRLAAQELSNATTSSNTLQQSNIQSPSIKKLKKHHNSGASMGSNYHLSGSQQAFHNRNSEATSKPQSHSLNKNNHSNITNLTRNNAPNANNSSSSSSSAFLTNNVGLPRKLVRGQDVWLGRGAEQTRQILKCLLCGQSFRTLGEMAQHMKITQHHTNIISQEQINSWRQPESADTNNKQNKQPNQARSLEDNHDDFSDKFNDSDREDSLSNDDYLEQQKSRPTSKSVDINKNDSTDNNSTTDSSHGDSPQAHKGSPSSKPLTRSRKREREVSPQIKRESKFGRDNSTATSSSSQQPRQNDSSNSIISSSNLILNDQKQDSEVNKESRTNGNKQGTPDLAEQKSDEEDEDSKDEQDLKLKIVSGDTAENDKTHVDDLEDSPNDDVQTENQDEHNQDGDNVDEPSSETDESALNNTNTAKAIIGQKGETGDPLSALETMVEKSFDPRLRPGVANGGILQRLGIDEEVCPPWQHINYANWYAAAACGHPMAAALLAAGINLQNGIKLSRNISTKKNED